MNCTPAASPDLSFLALDDGRRIALRHRSGSAQRPTVLFLPGYASDMEGSKAVAIDDHCAHRGVGCVRLDYSGTGSSDGDFAAGTLERWLDEVLAVVDHVDGGKLIIAGSSMGGWIALHAALRRPARIAAVLGIAAAPDFTAWGFTREEKESLAATGRLDRANPYGPEPSVTHRAFWQSGEALRLLQAPIDLALPIRLVHGDCDEAVPVAVALELLAKLRSSNVQLRLIKGGGHRLSEPYEIESILAELDGLVELVER